jgi:hypothetical protein
MRSQCTDELYRVNGGGEIFWKKAGCPRIGPMDRLTQAEAKKGGGKLTPREIWEEGYRFMREHNIRDTTFLPYED